MTLAQLADLLQLRRQLEERTATAEVLNRAQLVVRGAARPHEVRVIGVRESIGPRACRGHHGALLEDENRAPRAGEREHALDCVGAFRIGGRVASAVCHA